MKNKAYIWLAAVIFAFVTLAHVARLVFQLPVHVGSAEIPMWLSWAGAVGAGALSIWGFSVARKS